MTESPPTIKAPPDRDIDSDAYVLVFADECVRTNCVLETPEERPREVLRTVT